MEALNDLPISELLEALGESVALVVNDGIIVAVESN